MGALMPEQCCDADPDKRPSNSLETYNRIKDVLQNNSSNNIWDTVYHNDVNPLLQYVSKRRFEYSGKLLLLPAGDLSKQRNSYDFIQLQV